MKISFAGCFFLLLSYAHAAPLTDHLPQDATLERVVLLTRHGIRSPTKTPEILQQQTGHVWAQWPVAPGEMTEHGKQALALMVSAVRQHYVLAGLLSQNECVHHKNIVIWADNKDHRTRESGDIWATYLTPTCPEKASFLTGQQADPIFSGPVTAPSPQVRNLITEQFAERSKHTPPAVLRSMALLQKVLAPASCVTDHTYCLEEATTLLQWKNDRPSLKGGLAIGGSAVENLLLEYAENMPLHAPPFGQYTPTHLIEKVFALHVEESQLIRRLPAWAAYKSQYLAALIQATLEGQEHAIAPHIDPHTKLLILAGHDTNLDMIASLYKLKWSFADQPDPTAPNTTLAFEQWHTHTGPHIIVRIFHQALEDMRHLTPQSLDKDMRVIAYGTSLHDLKQNPSAY